MGVLNSKIPWDLRRRGQRDSNRHAQKIKQAIKKNLHKIIAEEAIITTDGKRTTKVPVKYLDSYHFKHGYPQDGVGHGDGEPGDVLRPGGQKAKGNKAGSERGADIYDAEISLEELTEMMLEDLGLPWLEEKEKQQIVTKEVVFTDLRKKGPMANWAKRKTVLENIKRNATESNDPSFRDLREEDLRFRSWEEKIERHSNAVVYLMMDRSGSMNDHKRYLCKATFWWLCRFLEKRYDNVDVVFIAHDFDARMVPEKDFFEISNDGGTRCSSAYELAWQDIKQSRPANLWNVYCFHFSDGDNLGDDNAHCVKLVQEILQRVNMFAYGEVAWENQDWESGSTLRTALKGIENPRMMTAVLNDKKDVYKVLQEFLSQEMQNA
jgi:hypothetical protein